VSSDSLRRRAVIRGRGARGKVDPNRSSSQSREHEAPQLSLPQHPGPQYVSGAAGAKRRRVMRSQGTPRAYGRVDPHRTSGPSGEHEAPHPSATGKHHLYMK